MGYELRRCIAKTFLVMGVDVKTALSCDALSESLFVIGNSLGCTRVYMTEVF